MVELPCQGVVKRPRCSAWEHDFSGEHSSGGLIVGLLDCDSMISVSVSEFSGRSLQAIYIYSFVLLLHP